jgi:hypothetical protein
MVLHKPNESKPWTISSNYSRQEKTNDPNLTFNLEENQIECESEVNS